MALLAGRKETHTHKYTHTVGVPTLKYCGRSMDVGASHATSCNFVLSLKVNRRRAISLIRSSLSASNLPISPRPIFESDRNWNDREPKEKKKDQPNRIYNSNTISSTLLGLVSSSFSIVEGNPLQLCST